KDKMFNLSNLFNHGKSDRRTLDGGQWNDQEDNGKTQVAGTCLLHFSPWSSRVNFYFVCGANSSFLHVFVTSSFHLTNIMVGSLFFWQSLHLHALLLGDKAAFSWRLEKMTFF
ncbi:hypothetical protein L9F63_007547, partial [Diploptera punctata]